MSNEYTHQILRVVVAQICQTIGWHSIQTTPLELLVDILHKYLQEVTRETYRYTELYGRIEPNLDDVALAFRDLNIHLSDIEEYVNYVDSVNCPIDVPKYPVHKESNLNFLKPGSKEVLTRPVHVHEHLPPIYPDKEVNDDNEQNDIENNSDNMMNSHENEIFKKPSDIISSGDGGPINKKPRFAFDQEEGRPTREISSVMMTSSGFISPAREGKLPDAKPPILPETKPPKKSPSPIPNQNSINSAAPPLPIGSMENKFDKKIKKKTSLHNISEKERKRNKLSMGMQQSGTKMMNGANNHKQHNQNDNHTPMKHKLAMKKKKDKEKKHKNHHHANNILSERSVGNIPVGTAGIGNSDTIKPSLKGALNSSSTGLGNIPSNIKGDHQLPISIQNQNLPSISSSHLSSNISTIDIDTKMKKVDKLCSEPDKQKLNIFKKITSSKKDRDECNSKSPNLNYPDNQILSSIPEGTTITPAPPILKSSHSSHQHHHHHPTKMSDLDRNDRDRVIYLDDEQPLSSSSMSITKIPTVKPSNYSKLSPHHAARAISQDLEPFGTVAVPAPPAPSTQKSQTQRKPRKNKQAAAAAAAASQLEQSMPLNLSNPSPINMVKKDMLHIAHNNSPKLPPQTPSLPYSTTITASPSPSHKAPKVKKERKNKAKQKESKKDLHQLPSNMQEFAKNALNPLQAMFPPPPSVSNENNRTGGTDNPFLPNKDSISPLNSKLGKIDSILKQSGTGTGVGTNIPPVGATGPPFGPPGPNFPTIPQIPMFPFYPFPPRPGLIPSTSLFSQFQPMAGDNPTFKQYLPAMMRFDFNQVHKGSKLGSKFDDEERLPTPPPIPPSEAEKGYCNVAPLVPDSMKFQLSPPRHSTSAGATTSNQKLSSFGTSNGGNNNVGGGGGERTTYDNGDTRSTSHHQSGSGSHHHHHHHHQKSPKFTSPSDAPIEISDDEKPKSDAEDKPSSKHHSDDASLNSSKTSANTSFHSDYTDNRKDSNVGGKDSGGDRFSSPDRYASSAGGGGGGSGIGDYPAEREEKHEKRKEKEHKKGKKTKEGKIKKKKDKKDKTKNKDKTGKRKDKEEKKDKEKLKKLKKEKKKEKIMRALIYSSDDGKQLNDSGDGASTSGAVPKLTLKLGTNNSPQHSSDDRKSSLKGDRRESSPELARISPLVTRPPKQKNLNQITQQQFSSSSMSVSQQQQNHHVHHSSKPSYLGSSSGEHSNHYQSDNRLHSNTPSQYSSASSISNLATANYNYSGGGVESYLPSSSSSSQAVTVTGSSTASSSSLNAMGRNNMAINNSITTNSSNHSNNYNTSASVPLESRSNSNTWSSTTTTSTAKTSNLTSTTEYNRPSSYIDAEGNQVWICPACGRVDDGTPMIGCDGCDAWYHWVCVGIQIPPDVNEDWYCRVCITKKQEVHGTDKKRKRKKKNKAN